MTSSGCLSLYFSVFYCIPPVHGSLRTLRREPCPRSRIMTTDLLRRWREEPLYRFSDWPNDAVPQVAAGVYTIWRDEQLVYVGMAGRSLTAECIAA